MSSCCNSCGQTQCCCTNGAYSVGQGQTLVMPNSFQVIKTPCANDSSSTSTAAASATERNYPINGCISQAFTAPAYDSQSSFVAENASQYLSIGDLVNFSSLGYLLVVSISPTGTVTFKNLVSPYGITPGTIVGQGTCFNYIPDVRTLPVTTNISSELSKICADLPACECSVSTNIGAIYGCKDNEFKAIIANPSAGYALVSDGSGNWTSHKLDDIIKAWTDENLKVPTEYAQFCRSGTYNTPGTDQNSVTDSWTIASQSGGFTTAGNEVVVPKAGTYDFFFTAGGNNNAANSSSGNHWVGLFINGSLATGTEFRLVGNSFVNSGANLATNFVVNVAAGDKISIRHRYLDGNNNIQSVGSSQARIQYPCLTVKQLAKT